MKTPLIALVLSAVASQAVALSCVRPDALQTFERLDAMPEGYYVLYGQLTFDESKLPLSMLEIGSAKPEPISGQFTGKGLTTDGFTSDFVSPAQLEIGCAGPWCGSASSGVDAIYFVRASSNPVVITAGPCGGTIFERPSRQLLEDLTSCMQETSCAAR